MNGTLLAAALFLLFTVAAGVICIMRAPGGVDALLAALLFGTTGTGMTLVLAKALGMARLLDVALVFALLASILGVALVLRGWPESRDGTDL